MQGGGALPCGCLTFFLEVALVLPVVLLGLLRSREEISFSFSAGAGSVWGGGGGGALRRVLYSLWEMVGEGGEGHQYIIYITINKENITYTIKHSPPPPFPPPPPPFNPLPNSSGPVSINFGVVRAL